MLGVKLIPQKRVYHNNANVLYVMLPWKEVCAIRDLRDRTDVKDVLAKFELQSGFSAKTFVLNHLDGGDIKWNTSLNFGVDINSGTMIGLKFVEHYRQLFDVCRQSSPDVLTYVKSQRENDVTFEALFYLCRSGLLDASKALYNDGVSRVTPFRRNCLHAASTGDNPTIIQLLLDRGQHPLTIDQYGCTAADVAEQMSTATCVRLLKSAERNWRLNSIVSRSARAADSVGGVISVQITFPQEPNVASCRPTSSSEITTDVEKEVLDAENDMYELPMTEPNGIPKTTRVLNSTSSDVNNLFVNSIKYELLGDNYTPPTVVVRSLRSGKNTVHNSSTGREKQSSTCKEKTRRKRTRVSSNDADIIRPRPITVPLSRLVQREKDRAKKLDEIDHVKLSANKRNFRNWLKRKLDNLAEVAKDSSSSESESSDVDYTAAFDEWLGKKRLLWAKNKRDQHFESKEIFRSGKKTNFLHICNTDLANIAGPHPTSYIRAYKNWVCQNNSRVKNDRGVEFVYNKLNTHRYENIIMKKKPITGSCLGKGQVASDAWNQRHLNDYQKQVIEKPKSALKISSPISTSGIAIQKKQGERDIQPKCHSVTFDENMPVFVKHRDSSIPEARTYEEWLETKRGVSNKTISDTNAGDTVVVARNRKHVTIPSR